MAVTPCNVLLIGLPIQRLTKGTPAIVDAQFSDPLNGNYVDPDAVVIEYRVGADGAVQLPTVTKLGVGKYRSIWTLDPDGVYYVRAAGTGATWVGAAEGQIVVAPSAF